MNDHVDKILYHETTILSRLDILAQEITKDFRGKPLTVIAILHGGMIFLADLLRRVELPLKIETLSVASYHGGTQSSGSLTFGNVQLPKLNDQHVLLIDDILDTGRTLSAITEHIRKEYSPLSIKAGVLLDKKNARIVPIEANYVGFEIGNEFVIGYGLDYQGHYRNLPYIGTLKEEYISNTTG